MTLLHYKIERERYIFFCQRLFAPKERETYHCHRLFCEGLFGLRMEFPFLCNKLILATFQGGQLIDQEYPPQKYPFLMTVVN